MSGKKKIYAVAKGPQTGIFDSWDKVKDIVKGSNCIHKSFFSRESAIEFLNSHDVTVPVDVPVDVDQDQLQDDSAKCGDETSFETVTERKIFEYLVRLEQKIESCFSAVNEMNLQLRTVTEIYKVTPTPTAYSELETINLNLKSKVFDLETENSMLKERLNVEEIISRNDEITETESNSFVTTEHDEGDYGNHCTNTVNNISTQNRFQALAKPDDSELFDDYNDDSISSPSKTNNTQLTCNEDEIPSSSNQDQPSIKTRNLNAQETATQQSRINSNIIIIGDSIVKNINPKKLSKKRVYKFTFPGKTAQEISNELQNVTAQTASHVIIHAGTNNLLADSADVCTSNIKMLAMKVQKKYPNAKISISSLTVRRDIEVTEKTIAVNSNLKLVANKNNFYFIDNSIIDNSCLNGSELHLNAKGSALLAVNIIKFLRADSTNFTSPNSSRKSNKQTFHNLGNQGFQMTILQQVGMLLSQLTGNYHPTQRHRGKM